MNKKIGDAGNIASYQNLQFASGKNKDFDVYKYTRNFNVFQCKTCGGDYQRHAENGICLNCQQRVEFIVREHPHILRRVQNGGITI